MSIDLHWEYYPKECNNKKDSTVLSYDINANKHKERYRKMNITFCKVAETKNLNYNINKLECRKAKLDKEQKRCSPISHSGILFCLDWLVVVALAGYCFKISSIVAKTNMDTLFLLLGIILTVLAYVMMHFWLETSSYLGAMSALYTIARNFIMNVKCTRILSEQDNIDFKISELNELLNIVKKIEEVHFLTNSIGLPNRVHVCKEAKKYVLTFSFSDCNKDDVIPEDIVLDGSVVRCSDVPDIVIELSKEYAYNIISRDNIDFTYLDKVYKEVS